MEGKRRKIVIYAVVLVILAISIMVSIYFHLGNYSLFFTSYVDSSGIHARFQLLNGVESCGPYHVSKGDIARLAVKMYSGKLKVDVILKGNKVYSSTFKSSENVLIPINKSGFVVLKLSGSMASGSVDLTFKHS